MSFLLKTKEGRDTLLMALDPDDRRELGACQCLECTAIRETSDHNRLAHLLVAELKRLGFDAIVSHSTQDVDSVAWVVLTPYEAGGGMSVFVQTGKHGYRRSFGRGWDMQRARDALLAFMGLQDGAKMQAEKILREVSK